MRFSKPEFWLLGQNVWSVPFRRAKKDAEARVEKFKNRPVLFVSSNGSGLGHLTRLWSIERSLDVDAITYTLSSAHHVLGKDSGRIIYFPSYSTLGMFGRFWNFLMAGHFHAIVRGMSPRRIVFDGTTVYPGIIAVAQKENVPITWVQRGCWKRDADLRSWQRHNAHEFADQVVIPGDYGYSECVTVGRDLEPEYVAPIVLTRDTDLLSRAEARKALGLEPSKKLFLIQLGGSSIGSLNKLLRVCIDSVRELGDEWSAVVVKNPLANDFPEADFETISAYPLARFYNAFDAAVMPAGYNSSQECVHFGLPTVLLPNPDTVTDDQEKRARGLEAAGLALVAQSQASLRQAIRVLAKDHVRTELRQRTSILRRDSGADEAARAIAKRLI